MKISIKTFIIVVIVVVNHFLCYAVGCWLGGDFMLTLAIGLEKETNTTTNCNQTTATRRLRVSPIEFNLPASDVQRGLMPHRLSINCNFVRLQNLLFAFVCPNFIESDFSRTVGAFEACLVSTAKENGKLCFDSFTSLSSSD